MTVNHHTLAGSDADTFTSLYTYHLKGAKSFDFHLSLAIKTFLDKIKHSPGKQFCILGSQFVLVYKNLRNLSYRYFTHCRYLLSLPLSIPDWV